MSQLARRENAPHRAAFVTSLSRWYIRRLLGNLSPFHPCLRRGGPVLPLAGLRHPTDILPGNQGTASPFCLPTSVSGTGRGCRVNRARLPGHFPAWPRFAGLYPLRHRDPRQRQFGGTPRGCHKRNLGSQRMGNEFMEPFSCYYSKWSILFCAEKSVKHRNKRWRWT